MGKRGAKKTPTETLKRKGSPKATRPNRRAEVKMKGSLTATPPRWMSKDEKATWKTMYEDLSECGLLANVDRNSLSRYCTNWKRWLELRAKVMKEGETLIEHRTEYSISKVNPAATQMHNVAMELHKLEAMFGLSPADRAGLAPMTTTEDEQDPIIKLASFGDKQTG